MCSIVSILLYLYCRSGCQASVVASALTFHPPDPFYKLQYNTETKNFDLVLDSNLPRVEFSDVKAEIITTATKTKVPLLRLTHPEAEITIIYSHGNATDIGAMYYVYAMIASRLKVNVVGYDYTGYGASAHYEVRPTEKQTYKDIESVYDWCVESGLVTDPSSQIVLYGQSVGSGPSCYLASEPKSGKRDPNKKRPVAGLVLHSPIMSGLRVLTTSRMLACFDIYPNINRIQTIDVPVFIIHGQLDDEVGFHHGQRLLEAAPKQFRYQPWWVPERGHNDILQGNEMAFLRHLKTYIGYIEAFHATRRAREEQEANKMDVVSQGQVVVAGADVEIRDSSTV